MTRYIPIVKCREDARDRMVSLEGYRDHPIRALPNNFATQLEGWGG